MKSIEKLESMIAGWLKPLPHLPANIVKWISANLWWIVLIGVILSAIGVFGLISALLVAASFIGSVSTIYGVSVTNHVGFSLFGSLIPIIFSIAIVVVMAIAINPIKLNHKKGWDLLFLSMLLQAVLVVISAIVNFNAFSFLYSILVGAIGIAISAYLLYEIRSHFVGTGAKPKVVADKK